MKYPDFLLKIKYLLALAIFFNFTSCTDVEEKEIDNQETETPVPEKKDEEEKKPEPLKKDEYTEEKIDLGLTKDDKNYLLLSDELQMGSNFKQTNEKVPSLKGVRPESTPTEPAAKGLTESVTNIQVLNKPAELEFNFRNDSLYSFYFTIKENDFNKADKIYLGLRQFYDKKLGEGKEENAEEDTRHRKKCIWTEKFPYAVMTYNINTGVIKWGFQNTKP